MDEQNLVPDPCPMCGGGWVRGCPGEYYHIDNHGDCALASVYIVAGEVLQWNAGVNKINGRIAELEAENERLLRFFSAVKRAHCNLEDSPKSLYATMSNLLEDVEADEKGGE